jgi:hypothetical protein
VIDLYDQYDEVNAEMQKMAAESFEEQSLSLLASLVSKIPSRIYIGSGEDFDVNFIKGISK